MSDRVFGKIRAFVVHTDDPDHAGRVRLRIPAVLGDAISDWALPCLPAGGIAGSGWYLMPEVGAQVWAEFEEGDLHRPLWVGTCWTQGADVPLAPGQRQPEPATRLLKSSAGHVLQFDDAAGAPRLRLRHAGGAELAIDEHGSVQLADQCGARLALDAQGRRITLDDGHGNQLRLDSGGVCIEDGQGNRLEMSSGGVTLKGSRIVLDAPEVHLGGTGGSAVALGPLLSAVFDNHIHPQVAAPPLVKMAAMPVASSTVKSA